MRTLLRLLSLCAVVSFFPASLLAQKGADAAGAPTMGLGNINMTNLDTSMQQWHCVVAGKVATLQGDPIPGARVVVEPTVGAEFRTLKTDNQGEFITEYWVNVDLVREFNATVDVVKKGFLTSHVVYDTVPSDKPRRFPITLRDAQEDPTLLSRADLVSSLSAKLKNPAASDGLSPSGQKDYARGLEEFLDRGRADRSLASFTKVLRRDPSCLSCRAMLGLAQLDSGDWDGAERNFIEAITAIRADASKSRPEPLIAYGVMESWRQQPEKASSLFEEALRIAPQDSLALQELGRTRLQSRDWGAADADLQKALEAGAGPEAHLLRAEALLGESSPDAANKEMTAYLNGRDVKMMPLRVRQLWAQIKDRKKVEVAYAKVRPESAEDIDYLRHPPADLKGLQPAQDQSSLPAILSAVGKNVDEFFRNFPNTSSLEQVRQEKLHHKGKLGESREQKFRYLCFTPVEAGAPGFSEYRLNVATNEAALGGGLEGFMLTSGFAANSLLFHPVYQPEATFRYLGRQKLDDRDTLVIAFAQNPAKARSIGEFKSGDKVVTVFSQGLAWVDAQTYQILRLRTDLLTQLPEVRLKKQTTEIDFAEVRFNKIAQAFWLPRDVTVTVDWNGKLLRNMHQYSDFKVFSVDATEKIGKPKQGPQDVKEPTGPGM